MMWNHFPQNNKETVFSCRPLNAKIHMIFSVFSGDQKYSINENNFGQKCFGSRFYISLLWPICNKSPHLSAQERVNNRWTCNNMTLWTTKHSHNLYEDFKGFAEVALHNISKWGCSSVFVKITNCLKTTRKIEIANDNFTRNEDSYLNKSCVNDPIWLILRVWHGKNIFEKLTFALLLLWITLMNTSLPLLQSKWWQHLGIR